MNFENYIDAAWTQHEKYTDEVIATYPEGLQLLETDEDVLGLSRLICHIATEHNFKFDSAIANLESLKQHPKAQGSAAQAHLTRQIALMKYIVGQHVELSQFSVSDRTIIFITAAASFLFQKNFEKSEMLLNSAIAASHALNNDKDPAFRSLAMLTNNMAADIGQRAILNTSEKKLMIDLAHYARNFWQKAGTWLHVERAEYYLSKYYFKIADFRAAEQHGIYCLQICEKEKAEPFEHFFAHEAIALALREKQNSVQFQRHLEQMKHYFNLCKESDQSRLRPSLEAAQS